MAMMRGDGLMGEYGPFSSRNMFGALSIIGIILLLIFIGAMTPWWPWAWPYG